MRDPLEAPSMYSIAAYRPKPQGELDRCLNLPVDLWLLALCDEPAADDSRALAGEIRTIESDGFTLFGAFLRAFVGYAFFTSLCGESVLGIDLIQSGEHAVTARFGADSVITHVVDAVAMFGFGRPPEEVTLIAVLSALWVLLPILANVVITTRKKAWRHAILDLRHQTLVIREGYVWLQSLREIDRGEPRLERLFPDPKPRRGFLLRRMRMD